MLSGGHQVLTLLSSGGNPPSESDSVFTLPASHVLPEPVSEKSRQNKHSQRPLKRDFRDLIEKCVSRQDLVRMLGLKQINKQVIDCRPKCCLTRLALENSGELECGKGGETAWSI